MSRVVRKLRADGDRWRVQLGERPPSPDVQLVLFFCLTTDQRPYRVVEVPRERLPDDGALALLGKEKLKELFRASRSMDFPRGFPTYSAAAS